MSIGSISIDHFGAVEHGQTLDSASRRVRITKRNVQLGWHVQHRMLIAVKFRLTKFANGALRVELLVVMCDRTRNRSIKYLVVVLDTIAQQLLLFEVLVHVAIIKCEHRVLGLLATCRRTLLSGREVDVSGGAER